MTQKQQDQIRKLRAAGEGYKKISMTLELSINTVKSFCRREFGDTLEPEDKSPDEMVCLQCKKPITQSSGKRERVFCSDVCRVTYWRTQSGNSQRKCVGCGIPLPGNDQSRKYCSHSCYIMHRFRKQV